ncbi:uncharacterized protein TRUGW13939_08221 [Talaromyces rugulosus]|uniref:WH1 domain-containing protein n=1 Tax=Talaromyces rugulosus TaxID=121627 RepID=A0A7H8R672_TALRU|nr:uncharacterized protein TRUGW13939_08221 [Talaromyces rugulosus]QKX61075.1 hypothetical protein TRUGW13939_08221 [Talaromyces rugulosus]
MTPPRKGRGGRPNNNINNSQYLQQYPVGVSDYESDNYYSFPDAQQQIQQLQLQQQQLQQQQQQLQQQQSSRTNEDLNNAVLRRHNPEIASILSLSPYVVVYAFNLESQGWEKTGMEGSMFVCQLVPEAYGQERYSVFVLNRRGLNNFDLHLTDENNVEITDEFVILKSDAKTAGFNSDDNNNNNNAEAGKIYGLWIYSEPPPNSTAETRKINAQVIKECAIHAGQSQLLAREKMAAEQHNGFQQPAQPPAPPPPPPPAAAGGDVLGDLFRRAGLGQQNL